MEMKVKSSLGARVPVIHDPPEKEGLGWGGAACYLVVHNKMARGLMRYTPGQVRQIVGVSQETLRHWRSVFGSLDGVRGAAPSFRPGQVLGLAVVRWIVEEIGLSVGALKGAERPIFEICGGEQWGRLARGYLLVKPVENEARFVAAVSEDMIGRGALVVPFAPIVAGIQEALFDVAPEEDQKSFPFPPMEVQDKGSLRAGGRRP